MRACPLHLLVAVTGGCLANVTGAAQEPLAFDPSKASVVYAGGDLGAVYHPGATTVKLWAPTAEQVRLLLFRDGTSPDFQAVPLSLGAEGVWSAVIEGDMNGKYYLYEITHASPSAGPPTVYRVCDPYARGCSANSERTLIFDPKKTNPEGWDDDRHVPLKKNTDAVVYEVHIRDFSIHPHAGVAGENRGKFSGMIQPGTRTPGGAASGLDHLKELGVTHVQVLPCFDYANGDERERVDQYTWYNWGYDPLLYNTPEGSYASNPDGTARQKEFKRMIQAFHRNHIGVVMDVVYNHTAATGGRAGSVFDKVYPGYYYRQDAAGHYANATGCGNEIASERPMVRKFIVDSVTYWMREYHVDGFRFDLMGILDRDTMEEVYGAARRINPNVILYGEGWDMERVLPAGRMMTQANVRGTGMAAFNDGIRDNIKGDNFQPRGRGFVQGNEPPFGGLDAFKLNLKGQNTGKGPPGVEVVTPSETINYNSAHDDLCLWDKLRLSAPDEPESVRIQMDKLAAGIVLTAQGVPFLHAGDEFLRSKNLNPNSYNNVDPRVNPIDWALKDQHPDVFQFYRGLIALRRAHPAFRMTDRARVDEACEFAPASPANVVLFVLKNHAHGDRWKNILVIYNGTPEPQDLAVTGDWAIVVNDRAAGTKTLATARNTVHVAAYSMVVAHTQGGYRL